MAFWSDQTLDPKRSFRWTINFPNLQILDVSAKSVTKPSFEVSNAEHWYINHHLNFPGRLKWNPISVTVVDIADTVLQIAGTNSSLLEKMNYQFPLSSQEARKSITKDKAVAAIGQIVLVQWDASGEVKLEEWTLINPWISKVEFGELSYEDEGLIEMKMDIIYDNAKVEGRSSS